jgi:uncharacterized protein with von Willebrand factor type A (vWA) domain
MSKFGAFYPIFLGLRDFGVWAKIKALAGANNLAGIFILKTLLEELFTLLDDYGKIESEFSKKLTKNLEKSLKTLKDLIDETQSAWERNRVRDIEKNFRLQENPDVSNRQATQESKPEGSLKQESSLQDPEYENGENPDQQAGKAAGSENLTSMTLKFMSSEKAGETLDSVIEESITAKIEELIPVLEIGRAHV